MRRRAIVVIGSALLVWTVAVCPLAAGTFNFTVTADPRGYHTAFGNVLTAINSKVGGPGVFHVSVGDIDDTPAENRQVVDAKFGSSYLWYPGIGNHEAETSGDMTWLRNEYHTGNGLRTPLKSFTNQDGPASCVETTYSWDYGNAHFVMLNEYWNGVSDKGTDGDVIPALYDWLAADLAANTRPFVFIFGHEPAYPKNRHVGDSLDKYPANRDRFWDLLESTKVHAYITGHTHFYSTYQQPGGWTWQIDVGNAGNDPGDGKTFLNVTVSSTQVQYDVWRDGGTGNFFLAESWTQPIPEPASLSLLALAGLMALRRRARRKH